MKIDQLEKKLLAAAKTAPPSDRVPFAFEKRIMARLKSLPAADAWAFWGRALWRTAAPCAAVMLGLSAWTIYSGDTADSEIHLEDAILAHVHLTTE